MILVALAVVSGSTEAEPRRLDVAIGDSSSYFPLGFVIESESQFGPNRKKVRVPGQVYRPARGLSDSALWIRSHNPTITADEPAMISFQDFRTRLVVDDTPVELVIGDVTICPDQAAGTDVVIACGYRDDSAFVIKHHPWKDVRQWLFVTTGQDATGDGQWSPAFVILASGDYDFDGRTEVFFQVQSGRDLRPRELFCLEVESLRMEWSLPVATGIIRDAFFLAGDSLSPRVIFASYNAKQGVADENFSDSWGYLSVVDETGNLVYNRVITYNHGGMALTRTKIPDEFFVSHSLSFKAADDTLAFDPVDRISRITLEGRILAQVEAGRHTADLWSASLADPTDDGVYVLSSEGVLSQYDAGLELVAQSRGVELRGFIDTITLRPEDGPVTLLSVPGGMAVVDSKFTQIGFSPRGGAYVEPFQFDSAGNVRTIMVSSGSGIHILGVERRGLWAHFQRLVSRYDEYLVAAVILMLLGLVLLNHRRYQAVQRLRQKEADYRAFASATPDRIVRIAGSGIILDYQVRDPSLIIIPPEDFLNRHITEVVPGPEGERAFSQITRTLVTGEMQTGEFRIEASRGTFRIELRTAPVGKNEVLAVGRDITDRKQTEEALRDSEQRFRSLVENLPGVIYRCAMDEFWTMEFISDEIEKMTGYPAAGFVGNRDRAFAEIVHPEDRTMIGEQVRKSTDRHEPYEIDYRILDCGGKVHWVYEKGQGVFDEGGRLLWLDGAIFDITDQKLAEEALREQEEKMRAQYKGFPLPTYTWQRSGGDFVLIDYNESAVALTDGGVGGVVGKKASEMYADRPDVLAAFEECFVTRQTIKRDMPYNYQTVSRTAWLTVYYVFVPPDLVMVHTEDITERRRSREELSTRLRYEAALAACSQALLTKSEIGDALKEALGHLLEASGQCRVYLFENYTDPELGLCFRQTHEVCRPGVTPHLDDPVLQQIPYEPDLGAVRAELEAGRPWRSLAKDMPSPVKEILEDQDVLSIIMLPVFCGREWYGFIGFDDTRQEWEWPDRDVRLLRTAAAMFGSYLDMAAATRQLQAERDFSRSILQTANSLIVCLDEEARITVFNDELEKVTGYRREEVLGKDWHELFLPRRYYHQGLADFGQWVAANPADRYERELLTRSGEERLVLWSNSVLANPETGRITAIAIGHDVTDRRRAEAAVHENSEKYQAIMRQSTDNIYLADVATGQILEANVAMQQLLGYSAEEMRELTVFDFVDHPEEDIRERIENIVQGELTHLKKRYCRTRDGRRVPVEAGVTAIEYGGRKVLCVVSRDITKRLETEEALREQEEKYRLLVENVRAAIALVDSGGRFIFVNDNAARSVGQTPEEMIGRTQWEVFPKELADKQVEVIRRVIATEEESMTESQVLLQGELRWFYTNLQPYRDVEGRTTAALVIAHDITSAKEAEQALQESEQRFRELADLLPQTLFEVDAQGYITYTNRQGFESTGYTEEDIADGIYFGNLFLPSEREAALENFKRRLAGEGVERHEYSLVRKNGTTFPVLIYSAPIIENGMSIGVRGVAIDITDRKKAEEAIRRANYERYQQMREIAGGISHEIYNSLYPSVVALEKIQNSLREADVSDCERVERLLQMAEQSVRRAISMTETVTQYSRLEAEKRESSIPVNELLNEILDANRDRLEELGIAFELKLDGDISIPTIKAHAYTLFNNLMINAMDALSEVDRRELTVETGRDDGSVYIRITDTGPGIPFEARRRIFEPFFSTKPHKGTGLGLAMARKIIELYGGRLELQSDLDTGTSFVIFFKEESTL